MLKQQSSDEDVWQSSEDAECTNCNGKHCYIIDELNNVYCSDDCVHEYRNVKKAKSK